MIGLAARLFPRLNRQGDELPPVTLLIAAYNEADVLAEKLENSLGQDYLADRLRVAVVADGSTDATCTISESYASRGVVTYFQPERQGKVAAVNRVMPFLTDPIVVQSLSNVEAFSYDRSEVPVIFIRLVLDSKALSMSCTIVSIKQTIAPITFFGSSDTSHL